MSDHSLERDERNRHIEQMRAETDRTLQETRYASKHLLVIATGAAATIILATAAFLTIAFKLLGFFK